MSQRFGLLTRRLLVVIAALVLGWLAVKIGITGIARDRNPELALWWSSNDSRALSNLADNILVESQSYATLNRAAMLSRRAIRADATNVAAVRILGFAQPEKAQPRYFAFANMLSKRDLGTQLWLIENQVEKGNARGALVHYDAALRTSSTASTILFPILSTASADRELAPEIAKVLAKNPDWALPFLFALVNDAPSSDMLTLIFESLKKSRFALPEPLTSNLTRRALRDFRYDLVIRSYFVAGGQNTRIGQSVSNGTFSIEPRFVPFDWSFASDAKMFVGRNMADVHPNDFQMVVQASEGVVGDAARQLLVLAPGRYRLISQAGRVPPPRDASVIWRIMCADRDETIIKDLVMVESDSAGKSAYIDFQVPSSRCNAQWIALRITSQTDGDGVNAWFDNVQIKPQLSESRSKDGAKSLMGTSKL